MSAAVAAVGVVAVCVTVTGARAHHAQSPSAAAPIPAGEKAVLYHGIQILVPDAFSVGSPFCGGTRSRVGVVLLDVNGAPSCPASRAPISGYGPRVAVVSMSPIAGNSAAPSSSALPTSIDGVQATRQMTTGTTTTTAVLVLSNPGITVTVRAGTAAAVSRIVDSVRRVATDDLGCTVRLPSFVPSGNAPADQLVPGRPTSAVLCSYAQNGMIAAYDRWLIGSSRASAAALTTLVADLDLFTPGRARPLANMAGTQLWIDFRYADGTRRAVEIDYESAPIVARDGQRTMVGDLPVSILYPGG